MNNISVSVSVTFASILEALTAARAAAVAARAAHYAYPSSGEGCWPAWQVKGYYVTQAEHYECKRRLYAAEVLARHVGIETCTCEEDITETDDCTSCDREDEFGPPHGQWAAHYAEGSE